MFSFVPSRQASELRIFLLRIADRSVSLFPADLEQRAATRSNCVVPAELIVWENDQPVLSETAPVLTWHISDVGLDVFLRQPLKCDQVVLGFWDCESAALADRGEPVFILFDIARQRPFGGGFWLAGLRGVRKLRLSEHPELEAHGPELRRLVPAPQNEREWSPN